MQVVCARRAVTCTHAHAGRCCMQMHCGHTLALPGQSRLQSCALGECTTNDHRPHLVNGCTCCWACLCPAVRVRTWMATMSGAVAVAHACGVECCRGHQEPAHSSAAHAVRLHAEPVMSSTQPRMPGLPAVYSAPRLTWKRQAADVIFPCGCVFAPQMQKAAGASARHRRALGIRADCDKGLVRHAHSGRARPLLPTPGTQAWL